MMWQSFATWLRRCGRHGTLFVIALVLTPAVLALVAGVANVLGRFAIPFFHLLWIGAMVAILHDFIRAWRHPPRLGKLPPLSQNDLRAARSKLMKQRPTR